MTRRAALALGLLLAAGCGKAGHEVRSRASMDHGLKVGDRLARTEVDCVSGPGRTVGEKGQVQVITFGTPYDCSECTPHIAGVSDLAGEVSRDAFMVIWSPGLARSKDTRAFEKVKLPVCMNLDGSLWDSHNLLHTPFTAVVRDGEVVYLHDGTFPSPESRQQFTADLRALLAQPLPATSVATAGLSPRPGGGKE